MLRKLVGGMMGIALVICIHAAWAAGAGDDADIAGEVRTAIKQLDSSTDRTAASRVNLAKIAITAANAKQGKDQAGADDAWQAALEALKDADRVEPGNAEVATLLKSVEKHIPLPATKPATNPVSVGPATKPAPETRPAGVLFTVKREVTPAEINRIRQVEWRHDENPPPGIRVDADVRKKFIAADTTIVPGDFNKLSQDAQAAAILDSGKDEFYPGVHLSRDPASIREFKIGVDKLVEQNCAGCHTGNKSGRFTLFNEKNDAAAYSNFLILQKYAAIAGGVERLMVDRTTPDSSLLLQYMLPATLTDAPHPQAPAFTPPCKTKNDPRYQAALKWLKSLDPLSPNYGIDLSHDAPAPVPAPAPRK